MRMAEITDVRLKDIPALCFNGVSVGDLFRADISYLLAGSSRANYGPYILTPC
jgi:hypothetical protein